MKKNYTATLARGVFPGRRWHAFNELWLDDAPERRPCTVCKEPTVWKRPRKLGAATHPLCEGNVFDSTTDELYTQVVFALAATLGATVHTVVEPVEDTPSTPRTPRLGNPQAGCELCGRSHAALWIAARTWRCAEHPPSNDTYRRRR